MKQSNIKNKVLLIVALGFIFSFSILGYLNTSNEFEAENIQVKEKNLLLTKQTSKLINDYLESKITIIEAAAVQLQKLDIT